MLLGLSNYLLIFLLKMKITESDTTIFTMQNRGRLLKFSWFYRIYIRTTIIILHIHDIKLVFFIFQLIFI